MTPRPVHPSSTPSVIAPLPAGSTAGSFVLLHPANSLDWCCLRYTARASASTVEVTVEEFAPTCLAERRPDGTLVPRLPGYAGLWAEGLRAFLDEAARFARPVHPALERVGPGWHGPGGAFRLHEPSQGRTLTEVLSSEPITEDSLLQRAGVLLDALQALHASGGIHGNVRPGSILIQTDGATVLADPAGVRLAIGARLPEPVPWPEPAFVAPELAMPRPGFTVGPSSDVYALAAVLRFCLSRGQPIGGRHLGGLRPPTYGGPSSALAAAIERALAQDPRDRTRSMAEFRRDLEASVLRPSASRTSTTSLSSIPTLQTMAPDSASDWPRSVQTHAQPRDPVLAWSPDGAGRLSSVVRLPSLRQAPVAARRPWPAVATGVVVGVLMTLAAVHLTRPFAVVSSLWEDLADAAPHLGLGPSLPSVSRPMAQVDRWPAPAVAAPSSAPGETPQSARVPNLPNDIVTDVTPSGVAISRPSLPAIDPTAIAMAEQPIVVTAPAPAPAANSLSAPIAASVAAKALPASPAAACAPRKNFALYVCLKTRCEEPRFVNHPQCVKLRETDEVP